MKKNQRGFTLLETILVLAILSLLLGIGLPKFQKPLAHYQLRSFAMQTAADLRWIRQQSVYGRAGIVKFWVMREDRECIVVDGNKMVSRRSLPPGIDFHEIELEINPLTFTIRGGPAIGGKIVFRNSFGELAYVYFMPSSGRIRVVFEDPGR